ncbi:MAG: preprotein translocase subunit YajC [Magnetococcales bacterium]|nr:preprotein translocase subunit YajC [Magnetococcales bacterium]
MLDLIANAFAEGNPQESTAALMSNLLFMAALFGIFYFVLIRPQQKQAKAHKEMVENLQRGDTVVTGGGMVGRIHRVEDDLISVEVGEVEIDSRTFKPVRIKVKRQTVTAVTTKASGGDVTEKS